LTETTNADGETISVLDIRILREFDGGGLIDISVFDGNLALKGNVTYSFEVELHLIAGVDENGFFIDANAVNPELTVSHIRLEGDVTAIGRLAFLEISLTDGQLHLDDQVRFTVDLRD